MQDKELLEQSQELVKSIFEKMTSIEALGTLKNSVGVGNVGIVMTDGGVIALDVLTVDQVSKVKEYIVSLIEENMKEDRHFLSRLNLLSRKPATINQDFEDAVQGMIESAKTPKVPEDAKEPELPFVEVPDAPKTNEMDDSVELDISQGNPPETQNTEPKIEKPWLNEALLRKELVENGLGVGEFAKKYDCKKSDVYNGKSKYGINTTTVQKSTPSNAKR